VKRLLTLFVLVLAATAAAWWWQHRPARPIVWQGYADADYVRVGPVLTGRLISLAVRRGETVAAGAPLFAQDEADDIAARDAATARVQEAAARLENLKTASRETEIARARADLADQRATAARISRDLARNETLLRSGAASQQLVDQQRADLASANARAAAAAARLDQMLSPTGRQYEIAAQMAVLEQARAALAEADWTLAQRRVSAPEGGVVNEVYAQPGETVTAGTPVVSLLPPENILVRFFIPEGALPSVRSGMRVGIGCDGCRGGLTARITYIAPAPEYTPPVIFSEESRGKLVFMIEAHPPADEAALLHPGQPVSVRPMAEAAK
jgi:HlyD family secretion protein